MIYMTNDMEDMEDINHVLIYDHTTPIAILKLPFTFNDCVDIEDWYRLAEKDIKQWSEDHGYDYKNMNAKAIKCYDASFTDYVNG